MKRQWTILIDTREQRPVSFPDGLVVLDDARRPSKKAVLTVSLGTRAATLPAGDYALEGFEDRVLVERKGSLREIAGNCLTADRRRFTDCLQRLWDSCRRPYLLLEGTPAHLYRTQGLDYDPRVAVDALVRLCIDYDVALFTLPYETGPQRQAFAEMIARLLIAGAISCRPKSSKE